MELWTSPSDRPAPCGDVGTDRGQCHGIAHRLTPLAGLSPTNTTGPNTRMASQSRTAVTPPTGPTPARPANRNRPPPQPVRAIPPFRENRLLKNLRKTEPVPTKECARQHRGGQPPDVCHPLRRHNAEPNRRWPCSRLHARCSDAGKAALGLPRDLHQLLLG